MFITFLENSIGIVEDGEICSVVETPVSAENLYFGFSSSVSESTYYGERVESDQLFQFGRYHGSNFKVEKVNGDTVFSFNPTENVRFKQ